MSFLVKQPQLPQSAANDLAPVSTYQEGNPIALGLGRDVYGSQWLCQPYNWKTAYGGQNQPEWQYCSVAAAYRSGPIDFVGKVYIDNKEIANWDYTFPDGVESHEFILNPSLALGQAWKAIVHRGSEDAIASPTLNAGTGQNHPPMRGTAWIEWINIDLGKGNTSLPNFTVEMGQHAPVVGAFGGGDSHPYGVNPIAGLWAILKERKGGFAAEDSLLDPDHWGDKAIELATVGINGRTGGLLDIHPCFKTAKDAGTLISEILGYIDGYLYTDGDQLKIGYFPHNAVDVSSLPEITEADLTKKPGGAGFPDWNRSATSVVVIFRDFDRDYQDSPAILPAPANRETGASPVPVRSDRPFCHAPDQAAMLASEIAASPSDDSSVSLTVKKSRAIHSGGAPLLPGDLFNWDYGPWTLDLACRVVGRRFRLGAADDLLEIIRERGEFPRPYVAPVDARVLPTAVDPGVINVADVRLFLLPSGFGTGRQVAALVDRSLREIIGARLSMSPTGSSPWEEILDQRYFAAKCVVHTAGISDSAAAVRIGSSSVDIARMAGQSSVNQTNDTLLLLLGNELMSVGAKNVVSAGVFDLAILRGRQGTTAAAHLTGDVGFLFFRSELRAAQHNEFYLVRDGSNAYDAAIATKHFKIALMTIDRVGLAKPDDPGLSLQLPDLTADGLSGYTILLTKEAQTVAADSAGTVAAGQLGATGVTRTDVVVLRGTTLLSAVAASPGLGQFAIALGTHLNATATKEDNDTVRADTLTADTGYIEIIVSVDGAFAVTRKFSITKAKGGAAGAPGGAGGTGATGNHIERRYKGSDTFPATPVGDNPVGWSIAPPTTFTGAIFYSEAEKTPANILVGSWSTPVRLSGTVTWYPIGVPATELADKAVMAGDGAYDVSLTGKNRFWSFNGTTWNDTQKILELADFGTGIKPIEKLSSLPAAGDAGRVVYLTTDEKLYRDTGSAWTRATDGADLIANSVIAGKLAAGSVSATEVGTNLLIAHSSNIGNLVVQNAHISSMDAGKITTGSLTAALSITSGGSLEAGSGYGYFKVDDNGVLRFGNLYINSYSDGNSMALTSPTGSSDSIFLGNRVSGGASIQVGNPSTAGSQISPTGISTDNLIGRNLVWAQGSLTVASTSDLQDTVTVKELKTNGSGSSHSIGFGNFNNSIYEDYGMVMACQGDTWPVRVQNGALLLGSFGKGSGGFSEGRLYFSASAYLYESGGVIRANDGLGDRAI